MFEVEIDTSSTQVTALRQKKKKRENFFFFFVFFFFSSLIKYLCKRKEANIEREADSCDAIPVVYAHLRDTRRTKKKKENKEEKKKKAEGGKRRRGSAAPQRYPLPCLLFSPHLPNLAMSTNKNTKAHISNHHESSSCTRGAMYSRGAFGSNGGGGATIPRGDSPKESLCIVAMRCRAATMCSGVSACDGSRRRSCW